MSDFVVWARVRRQIEAVSKRKCGTTLKEDTFKKEIEKRFKSGRERAN